ncbi:MAG: cytochrome c oxidase subunit II [Gemmataceae bacterium]
MLLIYFAIRFRRRSDDFVPKPTHGGTLLEVAWLAGPLAIALFIFVWASSVYVKMVRPPDDAMEVYVVGKQWMWKIQHAGGQREINTLHVPRGRPVRLIMTSEDVIHSFYVPAFRIKQDVLPGRYTTIWFEATRADTLRLYCAEYCGTGHSIMVGQVIVQEPDEFQRWLSGQAEGSMALEGRKLFQKLQCVTCHSADSGARAPVLEDLYRRRVPLQGGGSAVADEDYIRESILKPEAKIVDGFRPIMPTYQGQVSEDELLQLIAFIKALKPGQTPPRVEESAPPEVKAKKD